MKNLVSITCTSQLSQSPAHTLPFVTWSHFNFLKIIQDHACDFAGHLQYFSGLACKIRTFHVLKNSKSNFRTFQHFFRPVVTLILERKDISFYSYILWHTVWQTSSQYLQVKWLCYPPANLDFCRLRNRHRNLKWCGKCNKCHQAQFLITAQSWSLYRQL